MSPRLLCKTILWISLLRWIRKKWLTHHYCFRIFVMQFQYKQCSDSQKSTWELKVENKLGMRFSLKHQLHLLNIELPMQAAKAIFGNPARAKLMFAMKSPMLLPYVNTVNPMNESLRFAINPNADKIATTSAAQTAMTHIDPMKLPKIANN